MSTATESGDKALVVFVDEVQATIVRDEASDLLSVLDQLNTAALTDSGVGLLGLNAELLNDDTFGVGGTTKRVAAVHGT